MRLYFMIEIKINLNKKQMNGMHIDLNSRSSLVELTWTDSWIAEAVEMRCSSNDLYEEESEALNCKLPKKKWTESQITQL